MKRIFDLIVSILLFMFLSPLLLITAFMVRLKLGKPLLFKQIRPGLHGKHFNIMKFRTMLDTKDANGMALPDSDRLTSFGKFLRSTSLDELPGLFNVIKGDMSLVGPRPLLIEYLPLYSEEQNKRHLMKPGITGWAQVNGRNAITWEEKFKLDVWYVENQSLLLDFKILFLTVLKVLKRADISSSEHVTMEKFRGNQE